jgi:predicted transcriptional regulator
MLKEIFVFEDWKNPKQSNCLHRERLQIFVEILHLCQEPQVKTRVMYQTNLSYKTLQQYLPQLIEFKLLEEHHSIAKYSTTKKGWDFLRKYKELTTLLQT